MPHREHAIFRFHDLAHGLRLDAGLDSGMALPALGLAAEELHLAIPVQHRLVSAAPQGHLHRRPGVFIILVIVVAAHADADADRHDDLVADIDGLDFLEQGEMIFLQSREALLVHDQKVLVLLQLLAQRLMRQTVLVDLPVDQDIHQRGMHLIYVVHRFFVVIQINQRYDGLLLAHLPAQGGQLRLVDQVDHVEPVLLLRLPKPVIRILTSVIRIPILLIRIGRLPGKKIAVHYLLQCDLLYMSPQMRPFVFQADILCLGIHGEYGLRQIRKDRIDRLMIML